MSTERLAKRLSQELGLERNEAELYLFLSAMGPSPARMVARRFNLNRMKAYRNLKLLEEKGLIQSLMGRPVRYTATPLIEFLNRQRVGLRQQLADLEQNSSTLVEEWKSLASGAKQPSDDESRFRMFQGRQQVFELLMDMCDKAEEEVRIVTTTHDLARLSFWGLEDKFKVQIQKGRKIRLLTQIDEEGLKDIEPYLEFVDVRHVTLSEPIRFAIIDKRETLTTVAMDDSMSMTTKSDTGLWTDASSYVAAMTIFFDALWSLAPQAESVIRSIKTGLPSQEITPYMNEEEYVRLFGEMIEKAKQTIDIMANDESALPVPLEEMATFTKSGVKLRILTKTDQRSLSRLAKIVNDDFAIAENVASTDLILLAVDSKEALINVPYQDLRKGGVWSNIIPYVETMLLMFRDYWAMGQPIQDRLKQMAQRTMIETLAGTIKDALEGMGWSVEVPGSVTNESKTYGFDALARNPKHADEVVGIDVLTDGSVFTKIMEKSVIHMDLKSVSFVIASLVPCSSEELRMAELYQIKVVYSETEEGLVSVLMNELK